MKNMKNLIFVILFSILGTVVNAQSSNFRVIEEAIATKNVSTLSKYFDDKVEITTPSQDDIFSKTDASKVMQSFFNSYNVSSFKLEHYGSAKGKSSEYAIGNMTASGQGFRVFIYISEKDGKTVIQQIQLEQD